MEVSVRRWQVASWVMVVLVATGTFMSAGAQRPDPHTWITGSSAATAEASDAGCDLVRGYARGLDSAFNDSPVFSEFLLDPAADFGDYTSAEAEDIIRDGNALIESLQQLDVPPPYNDAHEAFIQIVQYELDEVRFLSVDTSIVPDIAAYESAFDTVTEGELELARACPAAVDAVGGFIILNPDTQESPASPDDLPE